FDGLELMARQFGAVKRSANPDLELLGIVLFDFSTAGKVIRSEVRKQLAEELGDAAPVMRAVIRKSERGAYDMRKVGLLAHEYQARAIDAAARTSIAERIMRSKSGQHVERYSSAAEGLADDYKRLASELLLSLGDLHRRVGRQ
ncbi:MAG: hypothetical protein OEO77_12215, partial [Acidimicrobiia bacterium]|nr:hypothetical protein [Acidimicrobiia bacterium]